MCIFSYIASEFKTGDLCVEFSDEYADFRKQLLPWSECMLMLDKYCSEMNIPNNPRDFIDNLKFKLEEKAEKVDKNYPNNSELVINPSGEILLKKKASTRNLAKIKEDKRLVESKMPDNGDTL